MSRRIKSLVSAAAALAALLFQLWRGFAPPAGPAEASGALPAAEAVVFSALLAALLAFVLVRLLFRLAEWLRARGGGE